jgi:predicted NAD/FAD-dependent oxidoreductase
VDFYGYQSNRADLTDERYAFFLADKALKTKLESVHYSSRYAMGLFYDAQEVPFQKTTTAVNFVEGDPVIRYWSIENKKRAAGSADAIDEPCAVVVHTSTTYGAEHSEDTPEAMKSSLLDKVNGCLEILRSPEPSYVKCHKWKYSQVSLSSRIFPD